MIALLAVFVCSLILTLWLASGKSPLKVLDAPNERSLHEGAIPKTGGIALLVALFSGWTWELQQFDIPMAFIAIFLSALLVASISFMDDLRELSPLARIMVHAVAAAILVSSGLTVHDSFAGDLFSFLAIIWMLNLYNFMDGMDGFAGGMALSGFAFIGLAGYLQGEELFALLAWMVAAASAGFLFKNFPPAKIFMGDTGSAVIGFLAAAFSLWGVRDGLFPLWFPLLLFSPFVVDATVTLFRRLLRGEKVWQAHREHYYQRLVLAGWGHKKTVLIEYLLMGAVGFSALAMLYWKPLIPYGSGLWVVAYTLLAYKSDQLCNSKV
ncbi:MAG TPA: glycosyltransferase family 4 protein [Mariprofundaceae bacterium]|nr:glycosyltransferase family 4 protein [Mariprofundaceae bacterium]